MSSSSMETPGRLVRFGNFEVALQGGELRRKGLRIKLQDQPRSILILLLERPGDLISREDLRQRLWHPDTFVDFDHSLNTAMMRLREALGDSPDHPRFIETVPRKGYRFIAPVQVVSQELSAPEPQDVAVAPTLSSAPGSDEAISPVAGMNPQRTGGAPRLRRLHLLWIGLASACIVLLAGLAISAAHGRQRKGSVSPLPTARISSIMVLPMEAPGDKDKEKFADSMTDALTARLTQIPSLRVISRNTANKYEGDHAPLQQIARDLDVDAVVESTMVRSGDHVRITAELIQISTDRYLWASTYESSASDILTIQDQVIVDIADQIRIKVDAGQRASAGAVPPHPGL